MVALIQLGAPTRKSSSRRVLLLTAPRPRPNYTPLHFGDNRAPQGLGYVAAYLEKFGHEVQIVDLYAFTWKYKSILTEVQSPWRRHKDEISGRNWARTMDGDLETIEGHSRGGFAQNNSDGTMDVGADLGEIIESFRPDFIGMYIHTMSFDTAIELSANIKRDYPEIPQMCGGPHPAVLPETIPNSFDHVVVGEGEAAVLDINDVPLSLASNNSVFVVNREPFRATIVILPCFRIHVCELPAGDEGIRRREQKSGLCNRFKRFRKAKIAFAVEGLS